MSHKARKPTKRHNGKLMSTREVAAYLGVSKWQVYRWVQTVDDFPRPLLARGNGKSYHWSRPIVDAWLEAGARP